VAYDRREEPARITGRPIRRRERVGETGYGSRRSIPWPTTGIDTLFFIFSPDARTHDPAHRNENVPGRGARQVGRQAEKIPPLFFFPLSAHA
jgi:hypothetical protein